MKSTAASPQESTPDEILERVLSAMRRAEPSEQFAHAMLTDLQRQVSTAAPAAHSLHRRWSGIPFAMAAALALAGVLISSSLFRHGIAPQRELRRPAVSLVTANQTAQQNAENRRVPGSTEVQGSARIQSKAKSVRVSLTSGVDGSRSFRPNRAQIHPEDLAALEAAAPTQLEPPLAITSEERQIRRFTERHNAYQLAALDTRTETAHERDETDEFQRFFAPPPEPSGNLPLPPLEAATGASTPNDTN